MLCWRSSPHAYFLMPSAAPSTAPRPPHRPAHSPHRPTHGPRIATIFASLSPALNEACTMSAGTKAESPAPSIRFSRSTHCSTVARDDVEHLLLVGMLVEVVALSRRQRHVDDGELPRAGRRRMAQPAELPPVEHLRRGLLARSRTCRPSPSSVHAPPISARFMAIALKLRVCSVSAASTGSRSMLDAP